MRRRVEIRVFGKVQGVFFRNEAKDIADSFGLFGWIKNEGDGSVKIVAEGDEEKLKELVEWCRSGSEWSRVELIDTEWHKATGEFTSFKIS